jgi:hypothetical protein
MKMKITMIAGTVIAEGVVAMKTTMSMIAATMIGDTVGIMRMMMIMDGEISGAAVMKTRIMMKAIIGKGRVTMRMMTMMTDMKKEVITRLAVATADTREEDSVA